MLLAKELKKIHCFSGKEVEVTYKVPTAVDVERILKEQISDTDLVKDFVKEVYSPEIDDLAIHVNGETLTLLPGTYGLVHRIALDIVSDMGLTEYEKN